MEVSVFADKTRMTAIAFAKRISAVLLIAWAQLSLGISLAQEPDFPPMPPGFRIGMEIELAPTAFAKIASYFDFDALQGSYGNLIDLPDDFFDDYLEYYPEGLAKLPEDLRKKLTQGLHLENTVIHEVRPLVGSDGKTINREAGLILSDGALRHPPEKPPEKSTTISSTAAALPDSFEQRDGLIVPKHLARQTAAQSDWEILNKKWKALDPGVKRALVRWEDLSPNKKALLAIHYTNGNITTKKSLPRDLAEMFKRFTWSRDAGALEFRHSKDLHISDPAEFYRDVATLAKRAGVERKILHPEDDRIKMAEDYYHSAGLHYHISIEGKDLTEQGLALNRLELVRRIHSGNLADLTRTSNYYDPSSYYLYEPSARDKGLVRVIGRDRIEFRTHTQPLQDELKFNLRVLAMEKGDALKTIGAEIQSLMNDYVIGKIIKEKPSYVEHLTEYMTPEQRLRVEPLLDRLSYARRLRNGVLPEDFWEQAPSFLEEDSDIANAVADALRGRHWPKEFWQKVPHLMKQGNLRFLVALDRQADWPEEVWKVLPKLMTDPNPKVQAVAVDSLASHSPWPQEIWDSILSLMGSEDPNIRGAVKRALVGPKSLPDAVWPHVLEQLKSDNSFNQRAALEIIENKPKWSKEIWDEMPRLMSGENDYVAAKGLTKQSEWPKEFWDQVPSLLRKNESRESKLNVLYIINTRPSWPKEVWDEIPALLAHWDISVQMRTLSAIARRPSWPKEVSEQVHKMLNSPEEMIRSRAARAIADRARVEHEHQLSPRDRENRVPAQTAPSSQQGCAGTITARLRALLGNQVR
jgi:hypothetical protein